MNNTIPTNFYEKIIPIKDPLLLTETRFYEVCPEDWFIVITDLKGSTAAINSGKYKEVNVIGVSCIVACKNVFKHTDFPYVFGGDGATMLVPPEFIERVKVALSHTQLVAKKQFGFDLRIGVVSVKELYAKNKQLLVSKLSLKDTSHIALIKGGALTLAEKMIKESSQFLLPESPTATGSFEGLECRWNPVKKSKDTIMTLIVQVQDHVDNPLEVYGGILNYIYEVAPETNPVGLNNLNWDWPPRHLVTELKLKFLNPVRFVYERIKITLLTLVFAQMISKQRKDKNSSIFRYLQQMSYHTDHIKFDDTLRMILDLKTDQKIKIENYLLNLLQQGKIFYGTHFSDETLMTCYVQSLKDNHIHFVDGSNGGYTLAAKMMKAQKVKS